MFEDTDVHVRTGTLALSPLLRRERNWLEVLPTIAQQFSTCAKRQYAAVVLSPEGRVVGFGYNGSPPGMGHCNDGHCPRYQENSPAGSNYDNCIAQHAEANALLWSDPALRRGGTVIVNGPPCMGCAKTIASSGVGKLVHTTSGMYSDWDNVKKFLMQAGVRVIGVDASP
jgi:dCMP deaminase